MQDNRKNRCAVGACSLFALLWLGTVVPPRTARADPGQEGTHVLLLNSYHPGYRWSDNEQASMEEVTAQTRNLGPGSLIFIQSFTRDRNGKIFNNHDLIRLVCDHAPVPIYVYREERMGPGVIGDYLLEGRSHGNRAGELALRFLSGEAPGSTIPVATDTPGKPVFDFGQMQRFGIPESALPRESILRNKIPGLYETYRELVWITSGFILL